MDYILGIDNYLFQLFNSGLTCGFLDWLMPIITNARMWMPIILIAWLGLIIFGSKKHRVLALLLLVAAGTTDLISARVIKKSVGRLRPCSVEETDDFKCRLLRHKKSSKSFPSNHAANNAAFATVIWLFCGHVIGIPFAFIAFLVGYSRVYVGVHYPFDVFAGWLLGILVSYICVKLIKYKFPQLFEFEDKPEQSDEIIENKLKAK